MTINEGYNFQQCTSLKKLTTRYGLKINYASNMFKGCSSLTTLDTSNWDLSNLIDISCMFKNCTSLQSLDTSRWNLHKVRYAGEMLADCTNLVSIDLSDKLENCKSYQEFGNRPPYLIFITHNCPNLETLVGNPDNVRLFIGFKGGDSGYSAGRQLNLMGSPKINLATVNAIIRGVASSPDRKLSLILPKSVKSQVTEEYRKILELGTSITNLIS